MGVLTRAMQEIGIIVSESRSLLAITKDVRPPGVSLYSLMGLDLVPQGGGGEGLSQTDRLTVSQIVILMTTGANPWQVANAPTAHVTS